MLPNSPACTQSGPGCANPAHQRICAEPEREGQHPFGISWGGGRIVSVRLSVPLPAPGRFFLLQQMLHPTPGLIGPTGGGILGSVASAIVCLPALGSLPELAPQVFRSVIQATADKLFWRRFDFFPAFDLSASY